MLRKYFEALFLAAGLCLVFSDLGLADQAGRLRGQYRQFLAREEQPAINLPIQVISTERDGLLSAQIYAVLDRDFSILAPILAEPGNWCDLVPLVFNVKACAFHREDKRGVQLTFYVGRKSYMPLEKSFALQYDFSLRSWGEDYLHISLAAEEGPLGTSDYLLEVEALKVEGKSFLSVHTSYRQSMVSNFATSGYLATLGRNKKGFTVIGGTPQKPRYIRGLRGIVERNAVRYFLALQAYLETRHLPADKRFAAAANLWYDLTERYHEQLYEMDKAEYLDIKGRERKNQLRLEQPGAELGEEPTIIR